MFIIGVDPGTSGGFAVIPLYKFKETFMGSLKNGPSDFASLLKDMRFGCDIYDSDTRAEVIIEQPSLNPYTGAIGPGGQKMMRNSQSFWKLGRSLGQLEGIAYAFGYNPIMVHPIKWQNAVNCRTKGDKKVSLRVATQLFPFLNRTQKNGKVRSLVTHATADALLIALSGFLQYCEEKHLPREVKNHVYGSTNERTVPKRSTTTRTGPAVTQRSDRRLPPRKRA